MDMNKLFQIPQPRTDFNTLDGAAAALMGVAVGAILSDVFKQNSEQATKPQDQTQPVNPYRGSQTVGDVEKALLQQPSSHRRERALRELAKYPETMPLAQLPTQTMHLLSGR